MNDEQRASTILAGIRDNLLKPMAREIEQSTESNSQKILEQNKEMFQNITERLNELIQENSKLRAELAEKEELKRKEFLQACMETTWEK